MLLPYWLNKVSQSSKESLSIVFENKYLTMKVISSKITLVSQKKAEGGKNTEMNSTYSTYLKAKGHDESYLLP